MSCQRNCQRLALLAVTGLASAASAQSLTLEFRADRTQAAVGETIHWEVWEFYDGYPDPEARFGDFVGNLVANTPEIGLSSGFLSYLNEATMPRANGASVENINIFSGCVMHYCPTYSGERIFTFDVEILEPFESLSYEVVGTASVFPDNGIFTLPDDYCREPFHNTCDGPEFEVISDVVSVGHIPVPRLGMTFEADRQRVYRGDTVRWTAELAFPGWAGVDSYMAEFAGDLVASDQDVGLAGGLAPGLAGEFDATPDYADINGVMIAQTDGGPPDASNPLTLLQWDIGTAQAGALRYHADGTATMFNEAEDEAFAFTTIVSASDEVVVEWNWPGVTQLGTIRSESDDWYERFGSAVAVNDSRLLVGAVFADSDTELSGAAYLFNLDDGEQLHRFAPDGGVTIGRFGFAVALDDQTVLIGEPFAETAGYRSGRAHLFDAASGLPLATLVPDDLAAGDNFGEAVAFAGGVALVGAPGHDAAGPSAGAVYVFDARTGEQISKILPGSGVARFGESIAGDGPLAVIGAPSTDPEGACFVHAFPGGDVVNDLPTPQGTYGFGTSVAIVGQTAAVGTSSYAAYAFDAVTGEQLAAMIPPNDPYPRDFGEAIAVSDHALVVGGEFYTWLFDVSTGIYLDSFRHGGRSRDPAVAVDRATVYAGADDNERVSIWDVSFPCTRVDLAAPWGVLDLADIVAFVEGYMDQRVAADIAEPFDVWDMDDLAGFVGAFADGCP